MKLSGYTRACALLVVSGALVLASSCGVGGSDAAGAGRGLVLLAFLNDSVDNTALNTTLEFHFSEAIDPDSVDDAAIQIREGPSFGANVMGSFHVEGSTVRFEPNLAGLCDHSDSGLKPSTQYRVQVVGTPEEFAVRSMAGKTLANTETFEFTTRQENDPYLYQDQMPSSNPYVLPGFTPASGAEAVSVRPGSDAIRLPINENLDPCTVNGSTVQLYLHQTGDQDLFNAQTAPNGNKSGFYVGADTSDQTENDHTTWGATTVVVLPQPLKILSVVSLENTFRGTEIVVRPASGAFPENALLVLSLSSEIKDYGHQPMTAFTMSFTTENLAPQTSGYMLENEGETPWDMNLSSAEINTARAVSLVQGYMLFAGDGDNGVGGNQLTPSFPDGTTCDYRENAGTSDDFDPTSDVLLDTGSTPTSCSNMVDGSRSAVWEFSTFRIRNGITVRVIGANPAIILVLGNVQIDAGARLAVRGDGAGGAPQGAGQRGWDWTSGSTATKKGGVGVAGGASGGGTIRHNTGNYGEDGFSPFGSPDGRDVQGGAGAGLGGVGHNSTYPGPDYGDAQGGGGGGHGDAGGTSTNVTGPLSTPKAAARGDGGAEVGSDRMLQPSAGGGGGGGGNDQWSGSYTSYGTGGGSGGAGGGFVDLTSSGNIYVNGTIDASGSRGGDPGNPYTGTNTSSGGGGGGGAGGGIRLLTPNEIVLGSTAVLTAAGGVGGTAPTSVQGVNDGGAGANGRIVLEDGDSVISGLNGATVVPGDGDEGFYRGPFDASRFQGGGLTPQAVSEPFAIGALNPIFLTPVQNYGVQEDFVAGIPLGASVGAGKTGILLEAQGFQSLPTGMPDLTGAISPPTGWHTIGHFTDSGVDNRPIWNLGQPTVGPGGQVPGGLPSGNVGSGIASLNTCEFIQLRITMYLPATIGPFDPGPYLDHWSIRFTHDQ